MISVVLERIVASETARLGSSRAGQLSAVYGLSGLNNAGRITGSKKMDLIITCDKKHLPVITKAQHMEVAQRVFDSSICLSHMAWNRSYGEMSSLNRSAAMLLAPIYSDVIGVIITADDIHLQLNRISEDLY